MTLLVKATNDDQPVAPAVAPVPQVACPRCRAVQPAALECRYCGIVFHKARLAAPPAPKAMDPGGGLSARPKPGKVRSAGGFLRNIRLGRWSHRLGDAFMGFVVSLAIALAMESGLLYVVRGIWSFYIATPVGQYYLSMQGPHAASLHYLAQTDLSIMALLVTATAMLVCLASGVIGQLLHLRRFLHESFEYLVQLLIWVPPLTAATGWLVHREDGMIQLGVAYVISFFPTLLLFNRSFALAKAVVPELATLIAFAGQAAAGFGQRSKTQSLGMFGRLDNLWRLILKR